MLVDTMYRAERMRDHLEPVFNALPEKYRGNALETNKMNRARKRKNALLINHPSGLHKMKKWQNPLILMTHDFGETFGVPETMIPDYLRDRNRHLRVSLFLPPGDHLHELQRRQFPHVPSVPVGCPKLDRWHKNPPRPQNEKPVVAVSFTWDWQRNKDQPVGAFSLYKDIFGILKTHDQWNIVGNSHPHMESMMKPRLAKMKIPYHSFDWIMDNADILVCDYSSVIYEFASTGRPVVLLNAPWYRNIPKDQSIRFWKGAGIGINCWHVDEVVPAIEESLECDPIQQEVKTAILDSVYRVRDGTSAEYAADVIVYYLKRGFKL